MRPLIAALILAPALAMADSKVDTCDPAHTAIDETLRAPLFDKLKATKSEADAAQVANLLWRDFTRAPDPHAQKLLDKGMRMIRRGEADGAVPILDALIAYCPGFAEGWNQRAFAYFLTGKYDNALEDIDRTLEIEPRHFGALSGKVLTLIRQGRQSLAILVLQDALKVHPWLSERRLLPEGEKI